MSNLPTLKLPVRTAAGLPLSGAAMYFYDAGTSNAQDTYSDEALTSANANPVVADANGYFGEIYMKDQAYKIVVKDAAGGSTLYEVDDTWPNETSFNSAATLVGYAFGSPITQGALGDGVADESAEVQAAITAAAAAGTYVVDLLGLVFKCNSQLTVPAKMTIRNGELVFSAATSGTCIKLNGSTTSENALTAGVAYGAVVIPVTDGTEFSTGDLFQLRDGGTYQDSHTRGEWCEVLSVSSNDVTVTEPIRSAYTEANTATAYKGGQIADVTLENLTITGTTTMTPATVINAVIAHRLRIRDCHIDGFKTTGIHLHDVLDAEITGCEFSNGSAASDGISSRGSRNVRLAGNRLTGLTVGIATDSTSTMPNREHVVDNNVFEACDTAISYNSGTDRLSVRYNKIRETGNAQAQIAVNGVNAEVSHNEIDSFTGYGIKFTTKPPATAVEEYYLRANRNVIRSQGKPLEFAFSTTALNYVEAVGNYLEGGDLDITCTADPGHLVVSGNILATAAKGINITGTADRLHALDNVAFDLNIGTVTTECYVRGNRLGGTNVVNGIVITACAIARIFDNLIAGTSTTTTNGILITACSDYAIIDGNTISAIDTSGQGISITGAPTNGLVVSNNVITGTHGTIADGLLVTTAGAAKMTIIGNSFDVTGRSILISNISGSEPIVISGNYFYTSSTTLVNVILGSGGKGIMITGNVFARAGDNEGHIGITSGTDIVIDSNVFIEGTTAIAFTTCTHTVITPSNVFDGLSVAAASGAEPSAPATLAAGAVAVPVTGGLMKLTAHASHSQVTTITGGYEGMVLTLFGTGTGGTLSFTSGSGADEPLLSAAYTMAAEDTLTLYYNGIHWTEMSRGPAAA